MAEYSEQLGIKEHTTPFGEAVISGKLTENIFSKEFISARAASLGTSPEKYSRKIAQPLSKLRPDDEVHLWFGKDMFCQMNLICVLAVLEKAGIKSAIFHEVFEDQMIEKGSTVIETSGFSEVFRSVLINHKPVVTSVDSVNSAMEMYFEFISTNGPLCDFIRSNNEDSVLTLTFKIIKGFAQYGLGDIQCKELILRVRGENQSE